jgi:hypothetical protein
LGPGDGLLLALGRVPSGAPLGPVRTSATRAPAPLAPSEAFSEPRSIRTTPTAHHRLFDYSRLHETPEVPQSDLERYVPLHGVPGRTQALANPQNIERVNEAARRGADQGGREFYNTEPLREQFMSELGAKKGQAAYDTYMNLVGATSPRSKVSDNIRTAGYYYMRSAQGLPPPVAMWDGTKWTLAEPPPYPWGHIAQGLHGKKVKEVSEQGGLQPLTNPKTASFVQNLGGNQRPVTIDRHNARLWEMTDARGHRGRCSAASRIWLP